MLSSRNVCKPDLAWKAAMQHSKNPAEEGTSSSCHSGQCVKAALWSQVPQTPQTSTMNSSGVLYNHCKIYQIDHHLHDPLLVSNPFELFSLTMSWRGPHSGQPPGCSVFD